MNRCRWGWNSFVWRRILSSVSWSTCEEINDEFLDEDCFTCVFYTLFLVPMSFFLSLIYMIKLLNVQNHDTSVVVKTLYFVLHKPKGYQFIHGSGIKVFKFFFSNHDLVLYNCTLITYGVRCWGYKVWWKVSLSCVKRPRNLAIDTTVSQHRGPLTNGKRLL